MKLSPPVLSWEINEIFKKDILKELQWAAASVLVLLLSLDNTVTGYEQSLTIDEQFNPNLSTFKYEQKIDSHYLKTSIKIYQLVFFEQKIDRC